MLPARARLSVRDLRLVLDGCADESVAAPPAPLLLDVRPSHQVRRPALSTRSPLFAPVRGTRKHSMELCS
jgi:hypothetical protein